MFEAKFWITASKILEIYLQDELFHLDKIIEEQRKEISNLKEKLTALAKQPADCESAQSTSSETLSCHNNIKDVDSMLDMTKKLQEATRTFSKTKKELAEARKVMWSYISDSQHDPGGPLVAHLEFLVVHGEFQD